MVPEKGFGTAVRNEVGTAPGVIFEKDGKVRYLYAWSSNGDEVVI